YIVCVFDKEFIIEKKLARKYEFYDFSEISGNEGIRLVIDEFRTKGISADEQVAEFLLSLYTDPDFLISEINKISDYVGEGNELNREVLNRILKFSNTSSSFEELFVSLIKKDSRGAITAADNILTYQAVSEIYLLAVLSSLFTDLILLKKSGRADSNNLWGERARMLQECSSEVTEDRLKYSVKAIIEADKMLKNTTVQPKLIVFNLISSLISFNG
ncbi:MAG: hypothetical protein N2510_01620, partial [Ignavibacteria bacterium]|nr:hypothetical protein [Ignavibacteria bacterium]